MPIQMQRSKRAVAVDESSRQIQREQHAAADVAERLEPLPRGLVRQARPEASCLLFAPLDQAERKTAGVRSIMNTDDVMGGSTTFTMISTTRKFQERNPKVYSAFVSALKEAHDMIRQDKQGAAQVLIDSMGGPGKWSLNEMVAMLNDPSIKYTTTPENVMKYAVFMHEIGSIKNRPTSIPELFFPGVDLQNGN